jgi:hypothetical protein
MGDIDSLLDLKFRPNGFGDADTGSVSRRKAGDTETHLGRWLAIRRGTSQRREPQKRWMRRQASSRVSSAVA